jgi:PAS domain S-box-containing protein
MSSAEPVDVGSDPPGVPGPSRPPEVAVLIVDDNATKRLALRSVLLPLGLRIVEAESGFAALRCLMAEDFAVILLDVRMPEMDGFETAGIIRKRRQSEMTPIIFITAYASDEVVTADHYVEGAVDFICAPVDPNELRAKVSAFAGLYAKAERLAAEARQVQISATQLRLLTEAAPIGIFQTDASNRYVYTNPRWSEITGMTADEVIGQNWNVIVRPEARVGSVLPPPDDAEGSEITHRFEIETVAGPSRFVVATSVVLSDHEGGVAGWVGTLADVTAEKEAERATADARDKANEASRLKSDFLANMSHEIRTPMNGVIGMTDLLLDTDLNPRQRDYAQTVRNSGEVLLLVINDILDFSKVEAGKLEIEIVQFNARSVIEDVVDLMAGSAHAKGLDLIVSIDPSVPVVVSGDPGRIRQVLTNLIGNSVKFTQTGEIVLRVSGTSVVDDGCDLHFAVCDTGEGIDPAKLDAIFEPFVQADSSTSRKHGGSGLGLAISAQLVALMGGTRGVTSTVGAGSTFWFTVRVTVAPSLLSYEQPPTGLSGLSVLIVDDNATEQSVLQGCLESWGMKVSVAPSGATALTLLAHPTVGDKPFDVVLVDQRMPEMTGTEFIEQMPDLSGFGGRIVLMEVAGDHDGLSPTFDGRYSSLRRPVRRDELASTMRPRSDAAGPSPVTAKTVVLMRPLTTDAHQCHLLLAEDNLINQKVAVAMLSGAGYHVETVGNGAAAVLAASAQSYDAILMDCQMPELDGYQATAAIRAHEGASRHTPIIAMTAGARREDRERCMAEGMDSYIAKPVSKADLLALVAHSIEAA